MMRSSIVTPLRPAGRCRAHGFTVLEVLVIVAILSLVAVAVMQTFNQFQPRVQLRGAGQQMSRLIAKARVTAIKRGVTTVVRADFAERSLTAFADVNGDPANPSDPTALYLVYDPDVAVQPDRTDFEISYMVLPGPELTGIQFGEPNGGIGSASTIVGLTPIPSDPTTSVLAFQPNGSVMNLGAFRVIDSKLVNSFEIALTNIVGAIEIRKFLFAGDAPAGEGYYAEGNVSFAADDIGKNIWVWY